MKAERITRLRQLLSEARPVAPEPAATALDDPAVAAMQRAFEYHEFNVGLPVLEQTPRARKLREITRIATWRGWQSAVSRALDEAGVNSAGELSDEAVDQLHERMVGFELSAQTGCDPSDGLHAA
jgi:cell division inhibitor SulA